MKNVPEVLGASILAAGFIGAALLWPSAEAEKSAEPEKSRTETLGLAALREVTDSWDSESDEDIADLGEAMCHELRIGTEIDTLFMAGALTYGPDMGGLMAFATSAYCPEFTTEVQAWSNSNS